MNLTQMTIISGGIYVLYVVEYILWNLYSLNNKKPKGSVGKVHPLSQMRRHIFFKLEVLFHFISLNELFHWTDHARVLVIKATSYLSWVSKEISISERTYNLKKTYV